MRLQKLKRPQSIVSVALRKLLGLSESVHQTLKDTGNAGRAMLAAWDGRKLTGSQKLISWGAILGGKVFAVKDDVQMRPVPAIFNNPEKLGWSQISQRRNRML